MSVSIISDGTNIWVFGDGSQDLSTVVSIRVDYTDLGGVEHIINVPSSAFGEQTTDVIKFPIPDNCNFTISLITATLLATEFSGSVELGPNVPLFENGSGIYKIVSGQTHDTVYINSPVVPDTVNIKIPNPFIKTGFIGG